MDRRSFIAFVGGAAVAWPLAARAQQPAKAHRIAVVHPSRPVAMLTDSGGLTIEAFFKQLHQLGYVEGQNLLVERYSDEGRTESYAALARYVVGSKPELIFAVSGRMVQHFKDTATTIPIVAYTTDPVALGFARSLARPPAWSRMSAWSSGTSSSNSCGRLSQRYLGWPISLHG